MDEFEDEAGFANGNYRLFFQMNWEWPCLSFDVLHDEYGAARTAFPHSCVFVSGTQAEDDDQNQLIITHLNGLQCTKFDDEIEDDAQLVDAAVKCSANSHPSTANRVRSYHDSNSIVATWADYGAICIWDVSPAYTSTFTDNANGAVQVLFEGEAPAESYGLAWSRIGDCRLVAGASNGQLYLLEEHQGVFVQSSVIPAHQDSIEDIVFSPGDAELFATCSCDQTIAIWDARDLTAPTITFEAASCHVNVIDWNGIQKNLLVSGDDSGFFRVWDLRMAATGSMTPAASFDYHQHSITSIEWNPSDESEIAVASEDGRVTIWDLSVEAVDPDEVEEGIPDQLLFEHYIDDPKELHFHPQIPSLLAVTGATFDIFIPDTMGDEEDI